MESLPAAALLSVACRRDSDAADRMRLLRERLETTVYGLGELDYLRGRQQVLVRAALELRLEVQDEWRFEEKLLEENIVLLRKKLNRLRRRDAGLTSQLKELDRQISDLQLDTRALHDQLDADSQPSSGFFDLSDGTSGSLSNLSTSVFSEGICSVHVADGLFLSADELTSCLECKDLAGTLCDDSSSSGTLHCSLSAPHPPTLGSVFSVASCDFLSKYPWKLVTQNGSDVYHYPSPLHAVVVQSPALFQMLGHTWDKGFEELKQEPCPLLASPVPQSSSWPPSSSSSQVPPNKRLESYIYSLMQRRALPVRANRTRTSLSTDPSKSISRQAILCAKQDSVPSYSSISRGMKRSELQQSWLESCPSLSPQRQQSVYYQSEEQGNLNFDRMQHSSGNADVGQNQDRSPLNSMNKLINQKTRLLKKRFYPPSVSTLTKTSRVLCSLRTNSTPKEAEQPCYSPDREILFKSPTATLKTSPDPRQTGPTKKVHSGQDRTIQGSFSQSPDEAGREVSPIVTTQLKSVRLGKDKSKYVKIVKVKTEHNKPSSERRGLKSRSSPKSSRRLDKGFIHLKGFKTGAGGGLAHKVSPSQIKCFPASTPEGQGLGRKVPSMSYGVRSSRHHRHGVHHNRCHYVRDQVKVAKKKYNRNNYHRLLGIIEVPHDKEYRQPLQRQGTDRSCPPMVQLSCLHPYVEGSDSVYSAECASLFHSSIMNSCNDGSSSYTTDCFGDSESGDEEYPSTSGTEKSGENGAGGDTGRTEKCWNQVKATGSRVAGPEASPAQANVFIKIKASHNLKKKILRFSSGSFKLMTTM